MAEWLFLGNGDYVRASDVIAISNESTEEEGVVFAIGPRRSRSSKNYPDGRWLPVAVILLRDGRFLPAYRDSLALVADLAQ